MSLTPVATVEYLKASRPLAGNDDLGVALAELDLPNVTAGDVDLLGDDGCAFPATRRPARRNVAAAVNPDGGRLRIEVGLQHRPD